MKKVITYTEDQIAQIGALLNGIISTGVQSAKSIAVIAQILDSEHLEKSRNWILRRKEERVNAIPTILTSQTGRIGHLKRQQ